MPVIIFCLGEQPGLGICLNISIGTLQNSGSKAYSIGVKAKKNV